MDFRFNINNLLPKKINKITHTLLPEGFRGDRREYNECQRLLTRILDDMGEASAKAQGLNRTITSAIKLRDTDHIVYLMVDHDGNNGLGSVVGLLKTGSKTLFMFDENGLHYQLKPRCILDFYIHETRQRMGLGNELYQYMLMEENIKPIKLAIDRPSDKFLAFLTKHYGLTSVIPQNNKFVVFKGFFDDEIQESQGNNRYSTPSPNRQFNDRKIQSNNNDDVNSPRNNSTNGSPVVRSAYGRYAAARPPCSMANIIHNTATVDQPEEHSRRSSASRNQHRERPDKLQLFASDEADQKSQDDMLSNHEESQTIVDEPIAPQVENGAENLESLEEADIAEVIESTAALTTSEKNGEQLKENIIEDHVPDSTSPSCSQEAAIEEQQPSGHLDLKFYHSPLW